MWFWNLCNPHSKSAHFFISCHRDSVYKMYPKTEKCPSQRAHDWAGCESVHCILFPLFKGHRLILPKPSPDRKNFTSQFSQSKQKQTKKKKNTNQEIRKRGGETICTFCPCELAVTYPPLLLAKSCAAHKTGPVTSFKVIRVGLHKRWEAHTVYHTPSAWLSDYPSSYLGEQCCSGPRTSPTRSSKRLWFTSWQHRNTQNVATSIIKHILFIVPSVPELFLHPTDFQHIKVKQ